MTISSVTRKAGPFTGNGTASTFPFAFKVFQASDILAVKLTTATNIETVLVLNSDYTVTLNADQNSNAGGTVTLSAGALASGYKLTLTSQVQELQETDLTNQGGFYPAVITNALDKLTIISQQISEEVSRCAKLPISSTADADALVTDIINLAADQANIDAVAGDLANIDAVAADLTNVDTVAGSIANVNAVGANIANVNAVAANETNINAVKNNATNINAVAANATNINAVAGNATNINAVAGNATNINAVNANSTNINTVAGISANVTTVAGIAANVTSVAGNASNINAVAGNSTNINAVAGNATNINAVNANKTNIDTVATNATAVTTVSTNITSVQSCATNMAAIIDAPNQAASAAASAAAAAASAASGMYSAVQDKSANYTIVAGDAGDLIRVTTTGGNRTMTLPVIGSTGITDGFKIAIVKWTGDANTVTIARSGSDTINGGTSYVISGQYTCVTLVADFETNQWFASVSGLGSTNVAIDPFSGNGSTTAFTLSGDAGTKNNTWVFIGGVYQPKSTYTLSGTTLTFSSAPPSGTNNIEVVWTQPLAVGVPSDGTVTPVKLDRAYTEQTSATGSSKLPAGSTAQRDASPQAGYLRFNNTLGKPEVYNGSTWTGVGGGATGGGADAIFNLNGQTVTQSYTIPSGQNAYSVGPITINSGVAVTVNSGSRWVIQ